jgi:hypothetical protein
MPMDFGFTAFDAHSEDVALALRVNAKGIT